MLRREDVEAMIERIRIKKGMDDVIEARKLLNEMEARAQELARIVPDIPSTKDTLASLLMTIYNLKNEIEVHYEELKRRME